LVLGAAVLGALGARCFGAVLRWWVTST